MKLIQTSAWYPPASSGGVEVYVEGLAQNLKPLGFECVIGTPLTLEQKSAAPQTGYYNGIEVYRYPSFAAFATWLSANQSGIYHQHTVRDRCGISHLRLARTLGMKTIMTLHMPEIVCVRGTMMQAGHTACDGQIEVTRCSQCLGVSKRVPAWVAERLSQIPPAIAEAGQARLRRSRDVRFRQLGTTLSTPAHVRDRAHQLREIVALSDQIVVVCQWLYDALVRNGVPEKKLLLSRHGVSSSGAATSIPHRSLTIGFLGRWQETKGVQILVEALQHVPRSLPVELIIHATHADQHGQANRDKISAIAASDPRIQIKAPLSRDAVPSAIAQFDLLAVPSQWLETGPLVVLEAHAVGTPVIGSRLGGIAELVEHGKDGWLVSAADVQAWAAAIAHLAAHPQIVATLKQGIRPVKTTREVAEEMAELYERLMRH
ncbi:glycosyltransferase [Myxacorys almedinensis]|uniref:Glycosyltransferase n=1 Tax=Myxacorys almedinensis A TaxID=2690445 RepID=A0A8J7YZ11_9CYAN|nr:glycosyltransferase [Myxacorys almedinensis]NDJ17227.1 glycosyltransferase [Myxacorys almedinensis A]